MTSSAADIEAVIDAHIEPADSPEGRRSTKEMLKKYFTALRSRDLEGIAQFMDTDSVVEIPFGESGKTDTASYRVYRGKDAILGFWATAFKAEGKIHGWSESDMTINGDGSRVIFEFRNFITMANGTEYRNRYVMRMDIADGKIMHCKEYYNPIQSAFAFGRPIAGKLYIDSL